MEPKKPYNVNSPPVFHILTNFMQKLTASQLGKKFPALYGIREFISPFTRERHLSLF